MNLPDSDEVIEELEPHITEKYSERLKSSANHLASGLAATALYLEGGGRKHPVEAYRIGSLIGINTRIIDDIMDGEDIPQVEDREKFLNNYMRSIEDEDVKYLENPSEHGAYAAGRILGENLDRDIMISYIKDLRDIAVDEEKSTVEGYKKYSRGISATIGEITAVSLRELEDFEPDTENLNFAYDFAYLGQVADDMMDGDTGLGDDIEIFHDEAVQRIKRHGVPGEIMGSLATAYPKIYSTMKLISDRNPGSEIKEILSVS